MTWRKRHLLHLCYIPCRNNHTTRIWAVLDLVDHIRKLIDSTSVRSWPATPLMTIYRTKVTILICPFVPDTYAMLLKILHVCITGNEPKQFIYDRLQMKFLCGQERKTLAEIIAGLITEHTLCTGTRTVRLHRSVFADMF